MKYVLKKTGLYMIHRLLFTYQINEIVKQGQLIGHNEMISATNLGIPTKSTKKCKHYYLATSKESKKNDS